MSEDADRLSRALVARAGLVVRLRLRDALQAELTRAGASVTVSDAELDGLVEASAGRAGGALWRRALAEAAVAQLGLPLAEAIDHPAVVEAHVLSGAPAYEPAARAPGVRMAAPDDSDSSGGSVPGLPEGAPAPDAVRVPAVHLGGIEALRAGERDLELRFSIAGLDVLKRSSGAAIGRLEWSEIETVDLPRARRGLRPTRRRAQQLHVATQRGRASFELPELTEEQLREHLEPMLVRARGGAVA